MTPVIPRVYTGMLPLPAEKLQNLKELAEYLHGPAYQFYQSLFQAQRRLEDDPLGMDEEDED